MKNFKFGIEFLSDVTREIGRYGDTEPPTRLSIGSSSKTMLLGSSYSFRVVWCPLPLFVP